MTELTPGQVTIGDLYRELVGMRSDLARSLTKLEVIESRNNEADHLHSDHEARLRTLQDALPTGLEGRLMSLEKFRWQMAGAFLLLNVLAVLVEWYLWSHR